MTQTHNPLHARITALTRKDFIVVSEISGPLDLDASIAVHLDHAFALKALFPANITDLALHTAITQALSGEAATRYINTFFDQDKQAPVSKDDCLLFYRTLALRSVEAEPTFSAPASLPYRTCSLAQTLWTQRKVASRRDAFILAALLCYPQRPQAQQSPRPPAPVLELGDYLDLVTVARDLLAPAAGISLAQALFDTLQASFFAQGMRYRAPTQREQAAGHVPNPSGKVLLPGAALNTSPAAALDALLHSHAFDQWALRLASRIQWQVEQNPSGKDLALAEQALVDVLYPPEERRAGYILDFELFSELNKHTPPAHIRFDLTNSVQASLGCQPALAELASELLLRRFAPELLLEDYPVHFVYQPDLNWANLRQGAHVLYAQQQPLTYTRAISVCEAPLNANDTATNEAQRDTLALWARLHKLIDDPEPWSAKEWDRLYRHYRIAWELEALHELPDRVAEARAQLLEAGLEPDAQNIDKLTHLEAYLDQGAGYANSALPDMNSWYETEFNAWALRAKNAYERVFQHCIDTLEDTYADQLRSEAWTCYAVSWPRYRGPVKGAVPSFGDSPADHWQAEIGTRGLLILLPGESSDTVLELFPEQLAWQAHQVNPNYRNRLQDELNLKHQAYNGIDLPWDVADFAQIHTIAQAPAEQRLQALAKHYAHTVALGDRTALHRVGKGATRKELFTARSKAQSDGEYLWKLLKNNVPGLRCFDVRSGADALFCGLDALALLGATVAVGGKLIRPLAKLPGTQAQAALIRREAMQRVAQRWASGIPEAVHSRGLGPRRWHSAPELTPPTYWPKTPVLQQQALPGQMPDGLMVTTSTENASQRLWGGKPAPVQISRADDAIDAIVNGTVYRLRLPPPNGFAQRLQHEQPLSAPPPTQQPAPFAHPTGPQIALYFAPSSVDAGTPIFGQYVSRAFHSMRIEPVALRLRSQNPHTVHWTHVMVRDGKVMHSTRNNPPKVLNANDALINYQVITPPVYHRRIMVEPLADFRFGLPDDMPLAQVEHIAHVCPPVRLGGIARTIADRRTLRAAIIEWKNEKWLIVEADTAVFYGRRYQPWAWQQKQLEKFALGQPILSVLPPRAARQRLDRIHDPEAINLYLDISESYRIVATGVNLQRDIDNLTYLLRDWLAYHRRFRPVQPSPYQEFLETTHEQLLPEYAKNILTQAKPQQALTGSTGLNRAGVVGLNKEIIPAWHYLGEVEALQGQHITSILNRLLPAVGSSTAYSPMSLADLLDDAGKQALRAHLGGANLAFSSVVMRDGSRRVYFSLSGGTRRNLHIALPEPNQQPPIQYIDAFQRMRYAIPDPRFSQIPVLRSAERLSPRHHARHLDSERMIASTMNVDLLENPAQVARIDMFTLLDTCRSCGGYVLPRLRLDYPDAEFSVTWLIPYLD